MLVSIIEIASIAVTAFQSCDGWSAADARMKNGSPRVSAILLTPVYSH